MISRSIYFLLFNFRQVQCTSFYHSRVVVILKYRFHASLLFFFIPRVDAITKLPVGWCYPPFELRNIFQVLKSFQKIMQSGGVALGIFPDQSQLGAEVKVQLATPGGSSLMNGPALPPALIQCHSDVLTLRRAPIGSVFSPIDLP